MTPLRKLPRKPVLVCLAALVLVAVVLVAVWPREPRFKGRAFSYWVNQLPATLVWTNVPYSVLTRRSYQDFLATFDDASRAVDALGPRCLETLVQRLQARETTFARLKSALKREGTRLGVLKPDWRNDAGWFKRGQAMTALFRLGAAAKPVVPEISLLAKRAGDTGVRRDALEVLRRLSPAVYGQVMVEQGSA
ncbi:MAG: hypothetical protein ACREIC_14405, partial [Limisphaerales bacterium]